MENAFLRALPFSPKEDALLTMALGTPVEPDENTMIGLSAEQLGNERSSSKPSSWIRSSMRGTGALGQPAANTLALGATCCAWRQASGDDMMKISGLTRCVARSNSSCSRRCENMAMRAPHSCTAAMITGVMMRLGNEKTTVDPGFSPHSS